MGAAIQAIAAKMGAESGASAAPAPAAEPASSGVAQALPEAGAEPVVQAEAPVADDTAQEGEAQQTEAQEPTDEEIQEEARKLSKGLSNRLKKLTEQKHGYESKLKEYEAQQYALKAERDAIAAQAAQQREFFENFQRQQADAEKQRIAAVEQQRLQQYLETLDPDTRAAYETQTKIQLLERKLQQFEEGQRRMLEERQKMEHAQRYEMTKARSVDEIVSASERALSAVGRSQDPVFRKYFAAQMQATLSSMEQQGQIRFGDPIPANVLRDIAVQMHRELESTYGNRQLDAKKMAAAAKSAKVPPSATSGGMAPSGNLGAPPEFKGGLQGRKERLMWAAKNGTINDILKTE